MTLPKFLRKLSSGDIALSLMRIETRQKYAKDVHLQNLADYLDRHRQVPTGSFPDGRLELSAAVGLSIVQTNRRNGTFASSLRAKSCRRLREWRGMSLYFIAIDRACTTQLVSRVDKVRGSPPSSWRTSPTAGKLYCNAPSFQPPALLSKAL
ncbi:pyocin activator PrtN family protein [Mesorhizobium sp. ZC-5]|nr:pyocin activator PrtN family protein [Mesorhizobium sp. ZC-5]